MRAPELTRAALFAALRRRDVYATTNARSLVDVTIGDAAMGQELRADAALRRQRDVHVRLTLHDTSAATVTLMRNGEPLASQALQGHELCTRVHHLTFPDTAPLDEIALRDARYHPAPFAVYYVRVEDSNGAHQWTSPIWIDVE